MPDYFNGCHWCRLCHSLYVHTTHSRLVFSSTGPGAARQAEFDIYLLSGRVFFYLKLALVCGLLIASPVLFHQLWRFIAPGLYHHEKKVLLPFTFISSLCFLGGAAFGYFVVFPPAFSFLIGYSSSFLEPMPAVSEYFSLALRLLLAFGVVFELPVFMVFLAKIGVVNKQFLQKNRKYALLIAFIVAAILTPTPDIVNQLLMAGPLIVLYEVSIIAVSLLVKSTFIGFPEKKDS